MLSEQAKTRKDQIALTAIDIISEGGTQNLSMVKIAERIGVTDAALYKHFKSKMTKFKIDAENLKSGNFAITHFEYQKHRLIFPHIHPTTLDSHFPHLLTVLLLGWSCSVY